MRYEYDYEVNKEIERLKSNLSPESLRQYLDYLERIKADISTNMAKLEAAAKAQLEIADSTVTVTKVFIERKINFNNHVEFYVWYEDIPEHVIYEDCPDGTKNWYWNWMYRREQHIYHCGRRTEFKGNQRREALKFAEALAQEKGGAEVIKLRF